MADSQKSLIKNIEFSRAVDIKDLVDYEEGRVVSRTFAAKPHVNITRFSFDRGEEISAHTSPGDAMVQVLDGTARITINGKVTEVSAGQIIVMPANVPHAVYARQRFKMLLTVVKQPVGIQKG
ncbi:MAG: cupin domain-containing protein [Desulfobacter sp.]|nr:MAG: cupin domain-containing protein [Desulfobacter sp.]